MEIIENGENLGFAEGNNVGIRRAMDEGTDYVLLLNNDTVVDPEFLGELVRVAEGDEKIGIVGPKIYYYDYKGRKDVIWFAGGNIKWWCAVITHNGSGYGESQKKFNKIESCDYITGCAFLMKKKVIEDVGYLDKTYFVYAEDADFCLRAKKNEYENIYVPNSKVWHKINKSSKSFSPLYVYLLTRNKFWLINRNYKKWQYFIYILAFIFYKQPIWICRFLLKRQIKQIVVFYRAIIDGLFKIQN